ncbi:hypothetical protein BHE90_000805 [Fusarium euwallaceae]|uniref:methylcrotonoyl-CoA carboxylase n=1 Tax=Fusarium euwallaceae TaxID=1147111 RepID=A0A430M9T8_9HYPO|nr:hypothetical protein BHE90_000805 [Fusarium euwallaceae]
MTTPNIPLPSVFPEYRSTVNENDKDYRQNVEDWKGILQQFEEKAAWAGGEGESRHIERHHARGMLSARDRIAMLLDEGSPFLELMPFAGIGVKESSPAASLIVGIGLVCGIKVMLIANIPTIVGGALNELTVRKQHRASEISLENRLPIIFLNQCAGANLPQQFRVFHQSGKLFRDIIRRSDAGSPTCTIVFGSSTAGGAYEPGVSEFSILVKSQAQMFLGGPPLVQMATSEISSAEELGGAEMHTTVSGVGDALAADEFDACRLARSWVQSINRENLHIDRTLDHVEAPLYSSDSMLGLISENVRMPLNMPEVIARIVDGSRFEPFKPLYGTGMLCCWARIHGRLVGIIGNMSSVIFVNEARKATQFIHLNNAYGTPIVYLHNVTGFMVGKKSESEGMIKAGSLLIDAVSRSSVPQISIVCGSSYGAGNYAMCGRSYSPRFLFSWPHSRCAVMGPEQLSGVMEIIARQAAERSGRGMDEAKLAASTAKTTEQIETESKAYYTSAWCLDDGIIDPRDTRDVLGMCLEVCENSPYKGLKGYRGVSRL